MATVSRWLSLRNSALFALQAEHADRSLIVAQWQGVEATHAVLFEKRRDDRLRRLRVNFPALFILVGADRRWLRRNPFQELPKPRHLVVLRHFGFSGYRAKNKPVAIEKTDGAAIEWHRGARLMHHRSQNMIQIESGSNFLADLEQRVHGVQLALGFQKVRVMQRDRCLLGHAREKKQILLVETAFRRSYSPIQ